MHINKHEISIFFDNTEIHAERYCFWLCCTFWASYAKSIGKEHLSVFITQRFIEKTFFLSSSKKVQKEELPEESIKKLFLKIPRYWQENVCVGVSFHPCWSPCNLIKKRLQSRCFLLNIVDVLGTTFLQNTSGG